MNKKPRSSRKPVGYIRFLALAFVAAILWMHNATHTPAAAERPAVTEGTTEQVMAEHGCSLDVALIDSTGVVVSVNGAATYLAGTEAAGEAFTNRATTVIHGFCR